MDIHKYSLAYPLTGHAIAGSFTWEKVEPTNSRDTLPVPRMFHALGYFGQIQIVIMFGGQAENETILGDTWVYDFSDNTWKEVSIIICNVITASIILYIGEFWRDKTLAYQLTRTSWRGE